MNIAPEMVQESPGEETLGADISTLIRLLENCDL